MFIKYRINFLFKKIIPITQIIMCHTSSEVLLYLTLWEIKQLQKKQHIWKNNAGRGREMGLRI